METQVHTIFPLLGIIKEILRRFTCTYDFINLKTFVCTKNQAFVPSYTLRMKSTESFINETPGLSKLGPGELVSFRV